MLLGGERFNIETEMFREFFSVPPIMWNKRGVKVRTASFSEVYVYIFWLLKMVILTEVFALSVVIPAN